MNTAKGWHGYLVGLAIQAYERASTTSGLRTGHSRAFAESANERFAQAAQVLVSELPRTIKLHFNCADGTLAVGSAPDDLLWTAGNIEDAKRVREVLAAHGIAVAFTSSCTRNCASNGPVEDEQTSEGE